MILAQEERKRELNHIASEYTSLIIYHQSKKKKKCKIFCYSIVDWV
jgi:hypothetical protein